MKPLLNLSGLSVIREGRALCHQVEWTIYPREHWVIVGPNGSGKSTLISSIFGFTEISEGMMSFDGIQYGEGDWTQVRRKIGWVGSGLAQNFEFHELTIDVVATGRKGIINHWKIPPAEDLRLAQKTLKKVHAAHLAKRPWGLLSQGERQIVMIARALITEPRLLFLDEPCAGLDPLARAQFLDFLEKWISLPAAPSIVLVTHHLEEIVPGFSNLMLIGSGKVHYQGPIREALKTSVFQKAFGKMVKIIWQNKKPQVIALPKS